MLNLQSNKRFAQVATWVIFNCMDRKAIITNMEKTMFKPTSIFCCVITLIVTFICSAQGDLFDQTLEKIKILETDRAKQRQDIEQELNTLRKNHELNAPKDMFESDADYTQRMSKLNTIVAKRRSELLKDYVVTQSKISNLYRRIFETKNVSAKLGVYNANREYFPITFNVDGTSIERTLSIEKDRARILYDNWDQVTSLVRFSIDLGEHRGVAHAVLIYPPIWQRGIRWTLNIEARLGANDTTISFGPSSWTTNANKLPDTDRRGLVFSPDGKYIATGHSSHVSLRETRTGRKVWGRNFNQLSSLAFSPSGKYVAAADNYLTLWETTTGREVKDMAVMETGILAFSPDEKYIALGQGVFGASLYEVRSGKRIWHRDPRNSVRALAFSPDGGYLAIGRHDPGIANFLELWDVVSGEILWSEPYSLRNSVNDVAFSPDGDLLAAAVGNKIEIWGLKNALNTREPFLIGYQWDEIDNDEAFDLAFSPDGEYLAVGNARVSFYRIGERITLVRKINRAKGMLRDLKWSSGGNLISDGATIYRTLLNPITYKLEN